MPWGPVNMPFAGSGHMVRNKLHWDANNAVGFPKQRNSYQSSPTFLCFESLSALFASQHIFSVTCNQIVQSAHCKYSKLVPILVVFRTKYNRKLFINSIRDNKHTVEFENMFRILCIHHSFLDF